MPLVVGGLVRFAINQRYGGNVVTNIWDVHVDGHGTADRPGAANNLAGIILDAWSVNVLANQSNTMAAESVSWIDMNSADGQTGSRSTTATRTWPAVGPNTDPGMPGNVSVLVRKITDGGRGQRNGRMYLAGIAEAFTAATTHNELSPSIVTTINGRMADFLTAVDGDHDLGGVTAAYTANSVVTRVLTRDPDGKPLTGDFATIQSLIVDPLLATQRRRLRR